MNRVVRACDGKVNKNVFNDLAKDVERQEQTLKNLLDQVNGINIPAPMQVVDDGNKYQELERMLVALEEKLERTREALSTRMNDINKFMDMIKEDLDKTLEEQDKQLMKTLSKTNICEIRIDALEKLVKDSHPNSLPNLADMDFKEAMKALKDLEAKINSIKDGKDYYIKTLDLLNQISNIEYKRLPTKADKSQLDELEKGLKDKVSELENKLLKLRMEFQNLSKIHDKIVKEYKKEQPREISNDRDEVTLMKKPLMGFKCANCERDLTNLEGTQTEFFNWKKLPHHLKKRKINMNLHNIGQGFSKMLQTMSTDNLNSRDLLKNSYIEEEEYEEPGLPSIRREFLSDNEDEMKKIMSPTSSRNKLK